MEDAEFAGGILNDAPDPHEAAATLSMLLQEVATERGSIRVASFDPVLVDVARARFGEDRERISVACSLGAAWVMGRRSVPASDVWDLVASLPSGAPLPKGLRRTTGETLMGLVVGATRKLRLVSPFIDRSGLDFLADALAAATGRGVHVDVLSPSRSTHADDAIEELRRQIAEHGDPTQLRLSTAPWDAPWAHLKVVAADSTVAYLGSANVTGAGMAGRNLELGVLVRGETVAVIERVLDEFTRHHVAGP